MSPQLTRKEFIATAVTAAGLVKQLQAAKPALKALIVVAHADDEYALAATTYRITAELGGTVDQVIITNGEAGYRYSQLAEVFYGRRLTNESIGRAELPEIRKQEALCAGKVLGIRRHIFLDQKDARFTLDGAEAFQGIWDVNGVRRSLLLLLEHEQYDLVFTLLPTSDTHGHHQAAALLALEAVQQLPSDSRPAVLGVRAAEPGELDFQYAGLPRADLTRVLRANAQYTIDRTQTIKTGSPVTYNVVVNWVIAEHKSQGVFQTDYGRHDREQFWAFALSGQPALRRAEQVFSALTRPSHAGQ